MTIRPPEPRKPWPSDHKIVYFVVAALVGSIAGGLAYNFLVANDPLTR